MRSRRADAAHEHVLGLEELVHAVVGALAAEAALLDATKGRHLRRHHALVHADHPVLERLRDAPGAAEVTWLGLGLG